jgi:GNAT superfamily N-acetyltransferase
MYHLQLPDREDRDRATLYLDVHPEHRRRGIGLALLRHAARQAAADGRSVLAGEAFKDSPGDVFGKRAGAKPGLADARRVLVIGKMPEGHVAALRSSAARAAAGYSLVTWTRRTPDEYLPGLAAVFNALNDGPRDAGRDDRIYDVERVRERVDGWATMTGNRYYAVAALHDATGELAAVTRVAVDPEVPEWGQQLITAVIRPHRGHRLGLLVKTAMLEWLASAEPGVARIATTNTETNEHMVAINEALGYELLDPQLVRYVVPVADVLG